MATMQHPYSFEPTKPQDVDCICIGTGRFLRAVLVPALSKGAAMKPALLQTRGRTFLDYMLTRYPHQNQTSSTSYEVDTVLENGTIQTDQIPCHGAFTLGSAQGKEAALQFVSNMERISIIGTGMTEAGLASVETSGMKALFDILKVCYESMVVQKTMICVNPHQKICVVNTDNVPQNGHVIETHMKAMSAAEQQDSQEFDSEAFSTFLQNQVVFLNSMVDRITSQRSPEESQVPKCEPCPSKAFVVLDPSGDLPVALSSSPSMKSTYGVVVRSSSTELQGDIALKLRIANGTHTAIAHTLALCSYPMTDTLSTSSPPGILSREYLESLVQGQILKAASPHYGSQEALDTWQDWKSRLEHPHFGLSSFFITQNGPSKGGIRLGPTVQDLLTMDKEEVSVSMAFAFAALLRWLTPHKNHTNSHGGVYRGWLDGFAPTVAVSSSDNDSDDNTQEYADGLRYNLTQGWYEFRCACRIGQDEQVLSKVLQEVAFSSSTTTPPQPSAYLSVIRDYLLLQDGGGNISPGNNHTKFESFVAAIATLYARMVAGDGVQSLLQELNDTGTLKEDCSILIDGPLHKNNISVPSSLSYLSYCPHCAIPSTSQLMKGVLLTQETIQSVVYAEVSSAETIDVHTHLLPPSHGGMLCLWGIDELLTYHYLVAEYFMTAPSTVLPEEFYAMSKQDQANLIWQAFFVDRSPLSEACRGVITTLQAFGLEVEIQNRDLEGIRTFYQTFRSKGLEGTEEFTEMVYRKAGVKYAIMTNIPFDSNEAQHWRPQRKEYPHRYRSALRVDPLLAGDQETVEISLKASGYDTTLEGARQYLRDWCDTMKPEYMMASTPHNFVLKEGSLSNVVQKTGVNEDVMKEPFAFVTGTTSGGGGGVSGMAGGADCTVTCDGDEDATASIINEESDFLSEVLMKVCEERDLPVALKIGAHRGVNPKLLSAGDGVVVADTSVLARLCTRFPKVRFLATFLSRNNQHEACVLASKFRNLHIYGCWWFCNNPSMIQEITTMRIEMLGTAFTAQHSDARVLDQLIYKWSHSRAVIAHVLIEEYTKLCNSGWSLSRKEIRRDVGRLFGKSYEEFMTKSFA